MQSLTPGKTAHLMQYIHIKITYNSEANFAANQIIPIKSIDLIKYKPEQNCNFLHPA